MNTENLSTLKIHKLTQAQYERELAAGRIDPNALYLTPDEDVDLSQYATKDELAAKANSEHIHDIEDVENLQATIDSTLESAKKYADEKVANLTTDNVIDEKIEAHNVSAEAHANMGWLTGEDEEIDESMPIDADTLAGHNVDYFATKKQVADLQNTLNDFVTEDDLANAIGNVDLSTKQDKITGTAGQFVVIGADGNLTTKTIPSAEGVTF